MTPLPPELRFSDRQIELVTHLMAQSRAKLRQVLTAAKRKQIYTPTHRDKQAIVVCLLRNLGSPRFQQALISEGVLAAGWFARRSL